MILQNIIKFCLLTLTFIAVTYGTSIAQTDAAANAVEEYDPQNPIVTHNIYADVNQITAGQTFTIVIEQNIREEWHTYWKNPGDSGEPTKAKWIMPDRFTASDIQWPVPKPIKFGPYTNFGYEKTVLYPVTITPPDTLPEGQITLTAQLDWLVCKEICIPEYGDISITFPVADETLTNPAIFDMAKSKLPGETKDGTYTEKDGKLVLAFPSDQELASAYFYPHEWGLNIYSEPQTLTQIDENTYTLSSKRDSRKLSEISSLTGTIKTVSINGEQRAFTFNGSPETQETPQTKDAQTNTADTNDAPIDRTTIFQAILFAFLGGIILNLMPCVFPVLSMKALSIVKTGNDDKSAVRLSGIAYTAGILLAFAVIAMLLIIIQQGGAQIGWGFQFQSPGFVLTLAVLLYLIGLNLSGFFDINAGGIAGLGQNLTQGKGFMPSFMTGILATLVATPCTAPFMATALGFAITQPAIVSLIIFLALGFGLALPYLAICFIPAVQKILPKPGAWMDVFKQVLAFPMYASAIWLAWVLSMQIGPSAIVVASGVMLGLTIAIWFLNVKPSKGTMAPICLILFAVSFIGTIWFGYAGIASADQTVPHTQNNNQEHAIKWQNFTQDKLDTLLAGDNPVFVDMTAAWCITCKVNEKVALNIPSTAEIFEDMNIQALQGDWTNQNPEITKYLARYGRNGVPLYVYYNKPDSKTGLRPQPVVLPQLLTPGIVRDYLTNR